MTQIATVKRLLEHGRAEILVCRQSACGHDCASCGGCRSENAVWVTASAENLPGAQPGDTVQVESASEQVLGMAFVLYMVPLVLLFLGYFIGAGWLCLSEGVSLVLGIAGLAIGIAINLLVDRYLRKAHAVRFRITEVLKSCLDM